VQQQEILNLSVTQRKRLSLGQLKHAVPSNLSCFYTQFASDADRNDVSLAVHANSLIFNELQTSGVIINRFTLVGWV
jgi:hypothetical protein